VPLPLSVERRPHTGLAIGFVGRLIPEKGLDLLFRAAVKLVGRWTITVVGTGPAQEELEGLAEQLRDSDELRPLAGAAPAAELPDSLAGTPAGRPCARKFTPATAVLPGLPAIP